VYHQKITGERHDFPKYEKGNHFIGDDDTDHGEQKYQCEECVEGNIFFVFQINTKIKRAIDNDSNAKDTQDQKEKCSERREDKNFWQWEYVSHQRGNSHCTYSYKKDHLQNVYQSEH